jgi:hypothetical protein
MQESHRAFREGSYTCGSENHPYPSGKRPERALKELKEIQYAVTLNTQAWKRAGGRKRHQRQEWKI